MMIHDITAKAGRYKKRKRVGRGEGSGHGKQSGRGQKGASSRSGYSAKRSFEGGQMPYFRRLAKFGFTNAAFRTHFWIVNLREIVAHPSFAKGGTVNIKSLQEAGLVRDDSRDLKILGAVGDEGLKVKLTVEAARVSDKAAQLITQAGGSVKQTGTRRDKVRGIDLTSEDRTPKNLTKKLKRSSKPKKVSDEEGDEEATKDAKAAKPAKAEEKGADKGASKKPPAAE
ncbi:MAG: 50S ribosomal protein L15 [Phycisphaeraceae bacterium]|nr:50S ribosomal protein L15 [Phycisphaeraceae bacterium]